MASLINSMLFFIIAAEFLRLKSEVEKRLDDLFTRDRDLVLDEGYAGTTVLAVALAKEDDLDLGQTTVTPVDNASALVSANCNYGRNGAMIHEI